MKRLLLCLFFILFSGVGYSTSIEIRAEFQVTAEYEKFDLNEIKAAGWKIEKNRFGEETYVMVLKITKSALPIQKFVGPAYFSINKTGLLKLGISVGDNDASSQTEIQLPMVRNNFASLPFSLPITNSGGDHAGGLWSFHGKLILKSLE